MAFTESEAKVLGALVVRAKDQGLTVRQLGRATRLPDSSIHRALLRLSRTGLVTVAPQSPARWLCTARGRIAITRPVYREFVGVRT
ncbi:helix-turn-helix domain-containing protein [Nocardia sp. JMUB6875]|uniref:helix-turn-helix domain-containing protein n=1 Tax=Nocardia sp. JMUB6875 TaxID=3158170 RepID=UPI0034E8C14A